MKRKLKVGKVAVFQDRSGRFILELKAKSGLLNREQALIIGSIPFSIGKGIMQIIYPKKIEQELQKLDPRVQLKNILEIILPKKTIKEVYVYTRDNKHGFYIARITLTDGKKYNIVPSTGIFLALIQKAPIYLDKALLPKPKILQPYIS